jgi:ABC-type amino acid transport substrate-binding protein
MQTKFCVAGLCAAAFAALGLASTSADAAEKKRYAAPGDRTERITVIDERGRARTRITVAPRSFLDPGNQVIPGDSKQLDYAVPPGHSPLQTLGPGRDFRRQPLLDPWDFPGTSKF